MRIAVTYENGNVFQHFGRTEQFKVYEVEDNKVVSSEIMGSNGSGHSALAGLLANNDIDVLICGGIGGGAQSALLSAGITVCAGTQGNTDEVVEAYLKGELTDAGVTCDHHHEDGHDCHCGEHEDHDCHCGDEEEGHECHCGGGCGGHPRFTVEGINAGRTCKVHYKGTFNDGTQFDSSYDRGEPLEFVCGAGMMILGFDAAVANMKVGEVVQIHLNPEEAYGMPDPAAVITIPIASLPGSENLSLGDRVYLSNSLGQQFPVKVIAKVDDKITFDANHEMAGKELNFQIELIEVQ